MSDRVEAYAKAICRQRIGGLCHAIGWQSAQSSSLQILTDLMRGYVAEIASLTRDSAEVCGRSQVNLKDLEFTLRQMQVKPEDLTEYLESVSSAGLDSSPVVRLPVSSDNKLNPLKPGSREVLHRKMHIYDHLPPMFPELETASSPPKTSGSPPIDSNASNINAENVGDSSAIHSNFPEPFGMQEREIVSVMMTSAGFISPAREGKLPESRTPNLAGMKETLQRETSPGTSPLTMVPPEDTTRSVKVPETADKLKAGSKRKDKLSVFKKPLKPAEKQKPAAVAKKDHTSNVLGPSTDKSSVEAVRSPIKDSSSVCKRGGQKAAKRTSTNADLKAMFQPSLSLQPPPDPNELLKAFVPANNPLMPQVPYGFGQEPVPPLPVAKEGRSSKEKTAKKKRTKKEKDIEVAEGKQAARKDKKDKKNKPEKPEKRKGKVSSASGVTLKITDSSLGKPLTLAEIPITTKVLVKPVESRTHKKPVEPGLFNEPIKLERPPVHQAPATIPFSLPSTSLTSVTSVTDTTVRKAKRGTPEKRDKEMEKEKAKEREKAKDKAKSKAKERGTKRKREKSFDGGGVITTQTVGHYIDADGNQIWICPACSKQDDGSPMIGCDECDDWYHWLCVGIEQEPEETQNWFCQRCVAKKQRHSGPKRGRSHKR